MPKTISTRLIEYRERYGYSAAFMAFVLGISPQVYYDIEDGLNGKFSPNFFDKITSVLKGGSLQENFNSRSIKNYNIQLPTAIEPVAIPDNSYKEEEAGTWRGVPMYNTPITANFLRTFRNGIDFKAQYHLHDPRFKDCDFGALITGDGMYSEIRHGDFVICKEITDKRFIVYGDIYYVVASNGFETCKYLDSDPEEKDNLLLVPRNKDISPSPIAKDMIQGLFKVKGIIRGY